MSEDLTSHLTLDEVYQLINNVIVDVLNGDSDKYDDIKLNGTLDNIGNCKRRVDAEGLMSKNEEIDDIITSSIKYLYLPYFSGKCYLQCRDQKIRRANLFQGKDALNEYLETCKTLKLLHESEVNKFESEKGKVSAEDNRNYKIEKFKRDKAAKTRIREIQRLLQLTKNDTDIDHEEEIREMMICQAQSYARDALDELEMIPQELAMLQFQDKLFESREEDARERQRNKEGNSNNNNQSLAQAYDQPPEHKGISITKTFKVGDKLMMSRDVVHATVFGSNIAPPTMTLAEFGDQQLKEAREREEAAANAEAGPRRYKQLLDEGLEDDEDLVEESAIHDRAWDDWKDSVHKGSGNKMGKRF